MLCDPSDASGLRHPPRRHPHLPQMVKVRTAAEISSDKALIGRRETGFGDVANTKKCPSGQNPHARNSSSSSIASSVPSGPTRHAPVGTRRHIHPSFAAFERSPPHSPATRTRCSPSPSASACTAGSASSASSARPRHWGTAISWSPAQTSVGPSIRHSIRIPASPTGAAARAPFYPWLAGPAAYIETTDTSRGVTKRSDPALKW